MYESFSIIFSISALLSYINYKWLKLPSTIGQMFMALGIALLIAVLKPFSTIGYNLFCGVMLDTNFTSILLNVMLGFLLFAGALHVDVSELSKERRPVILFATLGVLLSTLIGGAGLYVITHSLSIGIPFIHCLLFGALISPTDPIAVISLLESSNASKSLRLKIEGESLFNDGIGVIVFTGLLLFAEMGDLANSDHQNGFLTHILQMFVTEVFLGLVLGGVIGYVAFKLMKSASSDPYLTTVLSLAIVFGGYSLANLLHTSGPLAMVVAGLYIGSKIKKPDFNKHTKKTLVGFWHILDESLNGVLFVFIGLAIHLITFEANLLLLAVFSIMLVLVARFVSVVIPYSVLNHKEHSWINTSTLLTWGGLKGGISLALAFSLTPELSGETLLLLTYSTVIFSILVQGLTMPKLIKRLRP